MDKAERDKLFRHLCMIVDKGIEGSYRKQKAVFEKDERSKWIYKEVLKLAKF